MIALACGGRRFGSRAYVRNVLDLIHAMRPITLLVQGGAGKRDKSGVVVRGADLLAGAWALDRNVPMDQIDADWDKYGDIAGRIRNNLMLKRHKVELVVAFAGGNGTAHMRKVSHRAHIPIFDAADGMAGCLLEMQRHGFKVAA
jgi:hypothetical protein